MISRPLRDDLFVEGEPPRLLGSRCRETGELFYPKQVMNPVTHREGTMELVEIDGAGWLRNFTWVARGMPGFPTPFALGVVELEAGPTLTVQLADWENIDLAIDMPVTLTIGVVKRDLDGVEVRGPRFRPIVAGGDA